jgi:hypothetical protein
MQQTAEVIEKINVCAAVDVLIESVGLIDGGLILGNGVARERLVQKVIRLFLGDRGILGVRSPAANATKSSALCHLGKGLIAVLPLSCEC